MHRRLWSTDNRNTLHGIKLACPMPIFVPDALHLSVWAIIGLILCSLNPASVILILV